MKYSPGMKVGKSYKERRQFYSFSGSYGMLPHWLFLPVFVSSNLQYNEAENVDVPLPIFYAQAPFQANHFLKKK